MHLRGRLLRRGGAQHLRSASRDDPTAMARGDGFLWPQEEPTSPPESSEPSEITVSASEAYMSSAAKQQWWAGARQVGLRSVAPTPPPNQLRNVTGWGTCNHLRSLRQSGAAFFRYWRQLLQHHCQHLEDTFIISSLINVHTLVPLFRHFGLFCRDFTHFLVRWPVAYQN